VDAHFNHANILLTFPDDPPENPHELVKIRFAIFCFTAAVGAVPSPNGPFLNVFFPEFEAINLPPTLANSAVSPLVDSHIPTLLPYFPRRIHRCGKYPTDLFSTGRSYPLVWFEHKLVRWRDHRFWGESDPRSTSTLVSIEIRIGGGGGAAIQLAQDTGSQRLCRVRWPLVLLCAGCGRLDQSAN
jgi:hypothetical protein